MFAFFRKCLARHQKAANDSAFYRSVCDFLLRTILFGLVYYIGGCLIFVWGLSDSQRDVIGFLSLVAHSSSHPIFLGIVFSLSVATAFFFQARLWHYKRWPYVLPFLLVAADLGAFIYLSPGAIGIREAAFARSLNLGMYGDPFTINMSCPRSAYELEAIRVTATLTGQAEQHPFLSKLEASPEIEIQGAAERMMRDKVEWIVVPKEQGEYLIRAYFYVGLDYEATVPLSVHRFDHISRRAFVAGQVLGAIIAAAVGVLALFRKKNDSAPTTAQDSIPKQGNEVVLTLQAINVTASPVASGSGITQTVNSPTVTVNVGQAAQPSPPILNIEIREVCFDDVLESLSQDWSDYTFELYVFVYLWVVNTTTVPTAVKEWMLTLSGDGKNRAAAEVNDFSKWHQHIKKKVREPNLGVEGYVIKEERKTLTAFPSQPFQHGIPCQGWVCFKAYGITDAMLKGAKIELRVVDSFDQEHIIESPAPLACKGSMLNPELPW